MTSPYSIERRKVFRFLESRRGERSRSVSEISKRLRIAEDVVRTVLADLATKGSVIELKADRWEEFDLKKRRTPPTIPWVVNNCVVAEDANTQEAKLLKPQITGGGPWENLFCLGYRFKDDSHDTWTKRLTQFKRWSVNHDDFLRETLKELRPILGTFPGKTIVCPVIGHASEFASPKSPVFQLCREIGSLRDFEFDPTILRKRKTQSFSKQKLNWEDRRKEIAGAYQLIGHPSCVPDQFLLVDDVVTTGATMREAAEKLSSVHPKVPVICLALAKSESIVFHKEKDWPQPTNYGLLVGKIGDRFFNA